LQSSGRVVVRAAAQKFTTMFRVGITRATEMGYIGEVKGDKLVMPDGDLPLSYFAVLLLPNHTPNAPEGTKGVGFCDNEKAILACSGYLGEVVTPEEFYEGREWMQQYQKANEILFKSRQGNMFKVNLFIPYNLNEDEND
jgi:hypothetical protein